MLPLAGYFHLFPKRVVLQRDWRSLTLLFSVHCEPTHHAQTSRMTMVVFEQKGKRFRQNTICISLLIQSNKAFSLCQYTDAHNHTLTSRHLRNYKNSWWDQVWASGLAMKRPASHSRVPGFLLSCSLLAANAHAKRQWYWLQEPDLDRPHRTLGLNYLLLALPSPANACRHMLLHVIVLFISYVYLSLSKE